MAGESVRVSSKEFVSATMGQLEEITQELDDELAEAVHEAGKAARSYLRSNSPKRRGTGGGGYSRSWGVDFEDSVGSHEAMVANRKRWQLTHLLTDGHDSYNQHGGPYGHVGPANPEGYLDAAFEHGMQAFDQSIGK